MDVTDRDKVQTLWLTLALVLNELERLGEDVRMYTDSPRAYGESGCVAWNANTQRWDLETS